MNRLDDLVVLFIEQWTISIFVDDVLVKVAIISLLFLKTALNAQFFLLVGLQVSFQEVQLYEEFK